MLNKMAPTFFAKPSDFRKWLEKNHDKKTELIVGYYKVGSGKPSMSWSESVDQALCFGWIDGVRRSIDEKSYCIRFTPRRSSSIWSAVNIKKVAELKKKGLMHESGLEIFNKRTETKSEIYSYEKTPSKFSKELEAQFRTSKKAWEFFQELAPGYKKLSINWVMSAKQEATQKRRMKILIANSKKGINPWKNNKYKK